MAGVNAVQGSWVDALEQQFRLYCGEAPGETEPLDAALATRLLGEICDALESGDLRIVERGPSGSWRVAHGWVKRALVELAAAGGIASEAGPLPGTEFVALPWQRTRSVTQRVPAGTLVRRGAYLAPGTTVMPPSVVQAGARLESGVRVDSHALVGSAALLEKDVIVGCGTMIAGLLMPEPALPIIVEAGAVIGGSCGLYGPLVIGAEAQIYAGTVIRAAAGVFRVREGDWLPSEQDGPLFIPAGAHITMGVPPADAFPDGVARVTPLLL